MEVLKSRICGYLAADGSVIIRKENGTNRLHYDIQFYPDHYVLVRLFRKAFKEVYGKEVSIRQKRNFFYVRASDKFAAMDLVSLAKFSSRYWTIPKVLNSKASKKAWLKAYFDCDGYVCKRYVQIQSVNKDGLLKIRNLLNEFGIRSKIYSYQRRQASWNTNHLLNIQGRNMMLNFMHEIGFDHPLKYAKLKEFIGTLIGI
jgi:replication factor C small subunit